MPVSFGSYHTATSGRRPATRQAARDLPPITTERARPAVAVRKTSATPSTRRLRPDTPSREVLSRPGRGKIVVVSSASACRSLSCDRRHHPLEIMPCTAGTAPVAMVA